MYLPLHTISSDRNLVRNRYVLYFTRISSRQGKEAFTNEPHIPRYTHLKGLRDLFSGADALQYCSKLGQGLQRTRWTRFSLEIHFPSTPT